MDIEKIKKHIGKRIKTLRTENNLSQEQFSECVGISREHISCIEHGKYMISIDKLYNIAEYFEVDIKSFF